MWGSFPIPMESSGSETVVTERTLGTARQRIASCGRMPDRSTISPTAVELTNDSPNKPLGGYTERSELSQSLTRPIPRLMGQ